MTSFQIILLIIAASIGGGAAWLLRNKTHSEFLSVLLSFSGAYLLGVVVLHLLPGVFESAPDSLHEVHQHFYGSSVFILVGFFVQLLLVQFTRGIEHGHLHLHEHVSKGYVTGVLFGLSVHALLEGIPLAAAEISPDQRDSLYWGIFIHKIPETFALATILFFSEKRIIVPVVLIVLFSFMTPAGSFLGNYLSTEQTG
ncbi:MAG: ZIP family metal transporter, partial [Chitinophagales bacterium]|nr:ZIP family metal transporter [Chitinophagales bacterium]